jgi:hypothetical protein
MERCGLRKVRIGAAYLGLAAFTVVNSGCLAVAAAGAVAGGAAGYAYCKGKVCSTYIASPNDTWVALHAALNDLGLPIVSEQNGPDEHSIESRTANGERIRIYLDTVPNEIPTESPLTRICVRVATFGDHAVSTSILDQVSTHLVAPPAAGVPRLTPQATIGQPQAPTSLPETAPPPLLPAGPEPTGSGP